MRLRTFDRLDQLSRRVRQLERVEPDAGEDTGPVDWDEITDKPSTFPPTSFEISYASPATVWVVAHNLGTTVVDVNCFDAAGRFQYDPDVEVVDANTVNVHWYYPTAGIARVIG